MNWKSSTTLGSKKKSFDWVFSPEEGLTIRREFKNGAVANKFSVIEVENILQFVFERDWTPLANNVEKMNNGTEKEGLGTFVYNAIENSTVHAQATSQFAALMVEIGIFGYNGAKRGMEFRIENIDWQSRLKEAMLK